MPNTAQSQVTVGPYTGIYYKGSPNHPHVFLALGGRAGVDVVGPVSLEADFLHVPMKTPGVGATDIFSYKGSVRVNVLGDEDGASVFLVGGAGWSQWRLWGDTTKTEANPNGFRYLKGLGTTLGVGVIFPSIGPLQFRLDVRYEKSHFDTPKTKGLMFTLSPEIKF